MITLNYAKKIGDNYILNFYADTLSDLNDFDPNADFMFYGKPAEGSVVTVVEGEKTSFYLNDSGEFVEIPTNVGPEPGGDPVYSLTISNFVFDDEKPYSIKAFVEGDPIVYTDNWYLTFAGLADLSDGMTELEYVSDPKEGDMLSGTLGESNTLGNVEIEIANDDKDDLVSFYIGFDNGITLEQFNTMFVNLDVKVYKQ